MTLGADPSISSKKERNEKEVVAINPAANLLTVEKSNHELAIYESPPPQRRQRLPKDRTRAFRRRPHPVYCPRQITQSIANRDMAAIEAIHPDGRLSVRLDSNRQIGFKRQRASSSLPRLRRYQSQLPGPCRERAPRSRRYQRPPGPPQLPLRLRLHVSRQPRGHRGTLRAR